MEALSNQQLKLKSRGINKGTMTKMSLSMYKPDISYDFGGKGSCLNVLFKSLWGSVSKIDDSAQVRCS